MAAKLGWMLLLVSFVPIAALGSQLCGSKGHYSFQLLVMLPLEKASNAAAGIPQWDRGLEILPAAQLAADRINGDPNILPGYNLELIQVDTGLCTPQFHSEALVNFVRMVTKEDHHIVGIVGLFCTSVAQLISPFAGRSDLNLLQISGSVSPNFLHNQRQYPHLYQIVPSTTIYIDAVFSLMEHFEWTRIGVVASINEYDSHYFHTAEEFLRSAKLNPSLNVSFHTYLFASSLMKDLQKDGKRIIFASVGVQKAAEIICSAHRKGLNWPNYVWIFYETDLEDLILYAEQCNVHAMNIEEAIEGVFLLHYQLQPINPTIETITGQTYSEYYDQYRQYLNRSSAEMNFYLHPNPYANVLHDSVLAFALALNNSVQGLNMALDCFRIGSENFTQSLENTLSTLSFNGTLGHNSFRNSSNRESQIEVGISQVKSGSVVLVGSYQQRTGQIMFQSPGSIGNVPDDRKYVLSSIAVAATLSTLIVILMILTTLILIIFVVYRNKPEIKATSPKLSCLMFVGCYFLFVSTLVHTLSAAVVNRGAAAVIVCNAVLWGGSLGMNLVLSTLLVRMLRIYHIFNYFGKVGKIWSDRALLAIAAIIVGADVLLLLVWALTDTYQIQDYEVYEPDAEPPYYEVMQFCSCNYLQIWLAVILGEIGVLLLCVFLLAVMTRKIRLQNFKDTKKVNMYIFLMVMIICILIPLWIILRNAGNPTGSNLVIYLGFGATAFLCQLFLFLPKIVPPLFLRHVKYKATETEQSRREKTESQSLPGIVNAVIRQDSGLSNVSMLISSL